MTEDARARGSPTRAPHSHLLTPFVPEQRDAAIHQKSNHRSCLFPLKEAFLIRSTPELPPHFLGEFIPEHPRGGPRAGERETPSLRRAPLYLSPAPFKRRERGSPGSSGRSQDHLICSGGTASWCRWRARRSNVFCRIYRTKQEKNGKNVNYIIDFQVVNILQWNSSKISSEAADAAE